MMKIFGFVGSMRKDGNTNRLVEAVLDSARNVRHGIETEKVCLSDLAIGPCRACYDVCAKEPYVCVHEDDLQTVLEQMCRADAIVMSSALYFVVPSRLVAFTERLSCLAHLGGIRGHDDHPLEDKPCGLVAVSFGDPTTPVLVRLQQFALEMRMRPILLKSPPFLGVGGTDKMEKDDFLRPLDNAAELGRLLVDAIA